LLEKTAILFCLKKTAVIICSAEQITTATLAVFFMQSEEQTQRLQSFFFVLQLK
jgi:hypothetical protein